LRPAQRFRLIERIQAETANSRIQFPRLGDVMPELNANDPLPAGYVALRGSERHPAPGAKRIGAIDNKETFQVTVMLRRRPDGPRLPSFDYFARTTPAARPRLEDDEFAARYGAHPDDLRRVTNFAEKTGLKVVSAHAARRTVVLSGAVDQMSKAFGVTLSNYEHIMERRVNGQIHSRPETYRGRDGAILIPAELAEVVVGVFGLDNRSIARHNLADPPNTHTVTVQQIAKLYNFPANSAAGETIGIACPTGGWGGYAIGDIQKTLGAATPTVTPVHVEGVPNGSLEMVTSAASASGTTTLTFTSTAGIKVYSYVIGPALHAAYPYNLWVTAVTATTVTVNQPLTAALPAGSHLLFNWDMETTQDICIAAAAAPGANIAVFLANASEAGWVDMITRFAHPDPGDPVCSVLSSSWYICDGDDAATQSLEGISSGLIDAVSSAFFDAAMKGVTVCIASGDTGSNSKAGKYVKSWGPPVVYAGDGKAHVQYPASDPWVLSVGGTTVGNISAGTPPTFDEYVWNDPDPTDATQWGTTGGGVSDHFARPAYQDFAGVPVSVNDGHVGRGVPDVAGNASYHSGYSGIICGGLSFVGNGTSASAPHWAALIAVINAALGQRVGFVNPSLYQFGPSVFRDMIAPPGPTDNGNSGIPGYPAHAGWDACTGWGSPNGVALLNAFKTLPAVFISGGYYSSDVILTDLTTNKDIPVGGAPLRPGDTLLQPNTNYGFSARIHNESHLEADNVIVTFWDFEGGLGLGGAMVGAPQTVNIPPFNSVIVHASAPFVSAPSGEHKCAVVSIFSSSTGCATNAANFSQIPNPGRIGEHRCSAWRNTDSMYVSKKAKFKVMLGLGKPLAYVPTLKDPIELQVTPILVPANWQQHGVVREVSNLLTLSGAQASVPAYLLPELFETWPAVDVKVQLTTNRGGELQQKGAMWQFHPRGTEPASFYISGELPSQVKVGDILLLKVSAAYPKMAERTARTAQFLEVMYVTK
jgi:hypothetical protein